MPKFAPKSLGDEILGVKVSTSAPIFSKSVNFGPLFRHFRKALGQGYNVSKFDGPKFKNKKVENLSTLRLPLPIMRWMRVCQSTKSESIR